MITHSSWPDLLFRFHFSNYIKKKKKNTSFHKHPTSANKTNKTSNKISIIKQTQSKQREMKELNSNAFKHSEWVINSESHDGDNFRWPRESVNFQ